tara:strand:+ start:1002 stop:1214 length:213 start_codon:yes stop_codon:yes gene_type:complete
MKYKYGDYIMKIDENELVHILDLFKQGLYEEDWLVIEKAVSELDSIVFDDFDEFIDDDGFLDVDDSKDFK